MSTTVLTCDHRFVDVAHAAIAVLVIENNARQAFDDATARTTSRSPCHTTTHARTASDTGKFDAEKKRESHREAAIGGTWKKQSKSPVRRIEKAQHIPGTRYIVDAVVKNAYRVSLVR